MSKLYKVCKFTGGVIFERNPCDVGYEVARIERDRRPVFVISVDQSKCKDALNCQEYAHSSYTRVCPWLMCLISGSIKWLHEVELEGLDEDP